MNTVKTHTRNLYNKLGAGSREAAVRHANAVGLIGDGSSPG
jgi:ATP/maltotriose-dependent transcriptional regulator MalT